MATTSAVDLITLALKQIRVLGVGDTLTNEDAQDSLDVLNMMMESWSISKLYVYEEKLYDFPFVNGQASYTVGPSADFAIANRPLRLTSAYTQSLGISYYMQILTDATQYDALVNKGIVVSYPTCVWYEQTFPLGTLHFWPVPNGNTVFLRFWEQLQQFTSLTDTIALPVGYKECMLYNLAISLAGQFGIEPAATVVSKAQTSMARLKRYNIKPQMMTSEAAYMNRKTNRYNIMSDSFN